MKFSVITLAYGRVRHLENALACLLAQDYAGDWEVVVFNSCVHQTLVFEHPLVKIINAASRPRSLGDCRNAAIEASSGSHILIHDDDDSCLPPFISTFASGFGEAGWVQHGRQFYAVGNAIKDIVRGTLNVVGFTREAWLRAGKYASMGTGEDRDFVGRLTASCHGRILDIEEKDTSGIYSWGQGTWHISGLGNDTPRNNSYARAEADLMKRLRNKSEPSGIILLQPKMRCDWPALTKAYLEKRGWLETSKRKLAVVQLGRFGDIVNILPVLQHMAESYGKPDLIVASEFASLLEGVSYVNPVPINTDYSRILEGKAYAERHYLHHYMAQIWGKGHVQQKLTQSYNHESWRMLGFEREFKNPDWKPVFDLRSQVRELACVNKLINPGRTILVNVKKGVSSPFSRGDELQKSIIQKWGVEFQIIDLSEFKFERIYDVLGLMDAAQLLVSIDTSYLHLAAATSIPVVALVNPAPWQGSEIRCQHYERIDYNAAVKHDFQAVHKAIASLVNNPRQPASRAGIKPTPTRRLFHAVERHEEHDNDRKNRARESWDGIYGQGVVPCHFWEPYPRNATNIGDKRALPYLKDVIKFALDQAADNDIVFWTNDDNWLHRELPEALRLHVSIHGYTCSQRCEFKRSIPEGLSPEKMSKADIPHMGRDLFAATKLQWLAIFEEMGDPIIGASDFDLHLCALFRLKHGVRTSRKNIEQHIFPAEMKRGFIAHEFHAPHWDRPDNRNSAPSQIHNRLNFKNWARKHLPELRFYPNNVI